MIMSLAEPDIVLETVFQYSISSTVVHSVVEIYIYTDDIFYTKTVHLNNFKCTQVYSYYYK